MASPVAGWEVAFQTMRRKICLVRAFRAAATLGSMGAGLETGCDGPSAVELDGAVVGEVVAGPAAEGAAGGGFLRQPPRLPSSTAKANPVRMFLVLMGALYVEGWGLSSYPPLGRPDHGRLPRRSRAAALGASPLRYDFYMS